MLSATLLIAASPLEAICIEISISPPYRRLAPRCLSSCSVLRILGSSSGFALSMYSGCGFVCVPENVRANENPGAFFAKAPTALTASTFDLPILLTPTGS
eukprot:4697568-Pleurochrysis_carterae.AAC.1